MVDLLKTKTLPEALTSYDLLKALALILMVADHIGYFFFPEDIWWRVVGRLCVPIWFFLIGYANTREIPRLFWVAGGVVAFSTLAAGEYLFPLNIIFTLILARMSVDWLFVHALRNREAFAGMFFLLFLLSIPTLLVVEYGTLGLLFTLMGVLRRRRDMISAPGWMVPVFVAASMAGYILMQSMLLPTLSAAQFGVFLGGMIAVCLVLYRFQPRCFEAISVKRFPPVAVLQIMGRRTLEIYALHLIVLRAVALVFHPERFRLFDFDVFAFAQVQALFF